MISVTQRCVSAELIECDLDDNSIAVVVTDIETHLADTLVLIGARCTNPCASEPCKNTI